MNILASEFLRINSIEVVANLTNKNIDKLVKENEQKFLKGKAPFIIRNSIYIEARTEAQKKLNNQ